MHVIVRLKNVIVGHADVEPAPDNPRVAQGEFRPGIGWDLIAPVFELHAEGRGDPASGRAPDAALLERFGRAFRALDLAAFDDAGAKLQLHDLRFEMRPEGSAWAPGKLLLTAPEKTWAREP
jgi:hypothetical protein